MRRRSLLRLLACALLHVAACDTHRPVAPVGASAPQTIEVRAARGDLVFTFTPRGDGRFEAKPALGPALVVAVTPSALTVTRDGAAVMSLRKGPTGYAGEALRLVRSGGGKLHVIDGIGVTLLATEPLEPAGGTLGRDASGIPILQALPESDRVVLEGPSSGARLGTVHGVPEGPKKTVLAAVLGAPDLPIETRAAAGAFVLSP